MLHDSGDDSGDDDGNDVNTLYIVWKDINQACHYVVWNESSSLKEWIILPWPISTK